ncbi:hypothetical protein [Roseovarius atlanticus]|uniref:hypothetical protein n=1 Tax=Roseovarius atlanticus TaxID=1641875 RepID=UPI001C957FB3|nr:hypothetical protein [Roseovarius atlanticus]MBY6123606.1 hypothetical protein [Roseovarius atlanticus]MBY6148101.1 hypothetical protein [Roseovarius atlanticus]
MRIPFIFSRTDSLALEFTDQKMRVWRYGELVTTGGGQVYELDTPFLEADLFDLSFQQDSDQVYLADGKRPIQLLKRFALDNWEIADADFKTGPFQAQNLDRDLTIQCAPVNGYVKPWSANENIGPALGTLRRYGGTVYSVESYSYNGETSPDWDIQTGPSPPNHANGSKTYSWVAGGDNTLAITWYAEYSTETNGTVDLTAADDVFTASDVGGLLQIKPTDFQDVPFWQPGLTQSATTLYRNDGNIYELVAGTSTGASPPVHDFGQVLTDSQAGSRYLFKSSEAGIVRIASVTDARNATATIITPIPQPCIDSPTYRWARGAWSDEFGYPRYLAKYRRRLYAANSTAEPRTLWASAIGLFTDMEPKDEATSAFAYALSGDQDQNEITWLMGAKRGIYIGGGGEVFMGFSAVQSEGIAPDTFDTELVDSGGSAAVSPIKPYGFPVYVTADRTAVNEARYSFESDGSEPIELSLPSQHLGSEFFRDLVWQARPDRLAWLLDDAGQVHALLYDPTQDVLGWAPYPTAGGFVENLDVTVSADGSYDILTMIVRREIDGATVRYVEEQAINRLPMLGRQPETAFNHGFATSVFSEGAATAEFSLPHLAGETVYAWTDQGHQGPFVVAGDGTVTLDYASKQAIIGLADPDRVARTLSIEPSARDGDPRGRPRRISGSVGIALYKTAAGKVRAIAQSFADGEAGDPAQDLVSREVLTDETILKTGVRSIDLPTGHADEQLLEFHPIGIAPMTITALIVPVEEAGA